jgi:ATP-binding cassette subfamily B protein
MQGAAAAGRRRMPDLQPRTAAPPSTWTLFRLWRFARPYRWQLLAGFLLTLASTGATLVPPYLTMPLMDNVLIPFQNGSRSTGRWSRSTSAACSAPRWWPGCWAGRAPIFWRWFPNASARPAHHHLRTPAGLSLEYFGGKRTGDLMARIGSKPTASTSSSRCTCSISPPTC